MSSESAGGIGGQEGAGSVKVKEVSQAEQI